MAKQDFKARLVAAAAANGVRAGESVPLNVASNVASALNKLRLDSEHAADFSAVCGKYLTGPSLAALVGARITAPKVRGF